MTALERRYRRLLLAYPRKYRAAHGDELLDVLLESAAPGRSFPELRETWGLLLGGVRSRIIHQARGSAWADGLHLGVTAVAVANLAVLLPYAGSLPLWTALSALALLATLRGWVRTAIPLTGVVAVKAVALAGGWQALGITLLPVSPSALTHQMLFQFGSPLTVATGYTVVVSGLLALAWRRRPVRARSWWWWAVVVAAAWAGPSWMPDDTTYPLSLSRVAVEIAVCGLAVMGAYLARDLRWALASGLYLLVTSAELVLHKEELTRQHLAYWGLLILLTLACAFAPFRQRRHCLD
ncbi:hypothetical protein HTZ77_19915 [Nonomuraea sp. SMC257]|uniref:Uncharacterized protein n=1 Tax=Nonomuraea montanisoli TaxID=2741721 RepID=A0A7Y6I9N1_9ACTN|nr:hypothetical protein [Nonomuraea montanisoli]NUW33683.1 hypothetical protein [Nonomuraea montanisoli]